MAISKKNSFVLYTDTRNLVELLTDEQTGRLFKAIFAYVEGLEAPEIDNVTEIVFVSIKNYLDRDRAKYEEICRKRAESGKKGGEAKATKCYQELANVADSVTDIVTDIVTDTETIKKKKKSVKHKYGAYNNVLLSDEDIQKLTTEFPTDWEQRIEKLSEGIELKGYKYKNYRLAIEKWAENTPSNSTKGAVNVPEQRKGYENPLQMSYL